MPLCPQITNTPITVVLNADFTVTSVIPVLAADTVQVAAAQQSATDAFNQAVAAGTAASTAQTTANGKNKVVYSTSTPGFTANAVGDIWFKYGTAAPNVGRIIAQYIGDGGTSWTQTTVSGLVIANIDAGSITTGTISVGLGITTGTGTFTVNALTGALFANSATITGAITATSGSFTGTITSTSGTIGGFTLSSSSIFSSTNLVIEASGQISGGNSSTIFYGFVNIGGGSVTGERLIVAGNSSFVGQTIATGNVTSQTHFYTPFATTTSSSANAFINTASTPAGRLMRSTSSMRYKTDIQQQAINPFSVLQLEPKSFYDKKEYEDNNNLTDGLKRYFGLIAEEVALIPELASLLVSYDKSNIPDSVNYDRIGVALIPLLKNFNERLTNLGGE